MSEYPFIVRDTQLMNPDGEIDNDGLVDIHSGLGIRLGTDQLEYFDHTKEWSINGNNVIGSWYRLYGGPWNMHNHGSVHRNHATASWLRRRIINHAGPNVGSSNLSRWERNNSTPFHPNRAKLMVLLHGATSDPATHPSDHIGELRHARNYWSFAFVYGLLGGENGQLFTYSGETLTEVNWLKTAVSSTNALDHFITVKPYNPQQPPAAAVMLTHRDGSIKLVEQAGRAINQIHRFYNTPYNTTDKSPQIILIGHSMGGLVGRTILTNPADAVSGVSLTADQRKKADFLRARTLYMITIATPHEGSPQADKWSSIHALLSTNAPDWVKDLYAKIDTEFPGTLSYMGANKESTKDLRRRFWQIQNTTTLAPHLARRPNGQLIPIYVLSGRSPGGQYFNNPNLALGGITLPDFQGQGSYDGVTLPITRDELEAVFLVLYDYALRLVPGYDDGWGVPPVGSHDLDWVRRTTHKELAGWQTAAITFLLEIVGLPYASAFWEVMVTYMPYYLDKQWEVMTPIELAKILFDAGELVAAMLDVGFGWLSIGRALFTVLGETAFGTIKTLFDKGADVLDLTQVLRTVYNLSPIDAIKQLQKLPLTLEDLVRALKQGYGYSARQSFELMRQLGKGVGEIAEAVEALYQLDETKMAELLQELGFGPTVISEVLLDVYQVTAAKAAEILQDLGYGFQQIIDALVSTFNMTVLAATGIVKALFGSWIPIL